MARERLAAGTLSEAPASDDLWGIRNSCGEGTLVKAVSGVGLSCTPGRASVELECNCVLKRYPTLEPSRGNGFCPSNTRCWSGQKADVALDYCPRLGGLDLSCGGTGTMKRTSSKRCGRSLAVTVALTTTLFAASTAEAAKVIVSGVTVLDPASTVPDEAPGRTIAAWTADWWRWAYRERTPS